MKCCPCGATYEPGRVVHVQNGDPDDATLTGSPAALKAAWDLLGDAYLDAQEGRATVSDLGPMLANLRRQVDAALCAARGEP